MINILLYIRIQSFTVLTVEQLLIQFIACLVFANCICESAHDGKHSFQWNKHPNSIITLIFSCDYQGGTSNAWYFLHARLKNIFQAVNFTRMVFRTTDTLQESIIIGPHHFECYHCYHYRSGIMCSTHCVGCKYSCPRELIGWLIFYKFSYTVKLLIFTTLNFH